MSADINLDNINVDLDLSGSADIGLDEIAAALANVGVGVTVGGALDVGLANINANANVNANANIGLNDIRINSLPKIQLEFSMRPLRVHLPLHYTFCIELFGIQLFKFSLCGEGMVVTEDFQPHPSERCG
jgi:hypothetical protein